MEHIMRPFKKFLLARFFIREPFSRLRNQYLYESTEYAKRMRSLY